MSAADLPIQMFDRKNGKLVSKPMSRLRVMHDAPVVARMPKALVERLDRSAVAMYRSRSAEMIARLEASFANESIDEHGVIVVHSSVPLK